MGGQDRPVCPLCKGSGILPGSAADTIRMRQEDFNVMIANAIRTPLPPSADATLPSAQHFPKPPRVPRQTPPAAPPPPPPLLPVDDPLTFPEERVTLASDTWMLKRVKKIKKENERIAYFAIIALLLGIVIALAVTR